MAYTVNRDNCLCCGICAANCPTSAAKLDDEGFAYIDEDECCGCGECAYNCPNNAIEDL